MDAFTTLFAPATPAVPTSEAPRNYENNPGGMTLCVIA
ncbi:uncharacterized protein L203_105218 [Cryptococcus depauperatus CBS 7841]|uniref:Fungal mating-type pheromone n=1 Tax=Cryptococcus depauperatus CBS 7841 TaxID=1295531 RepID=A0AAJ8JWZ6_9TREE